jgi:predicted RNA-binding protein with PUA domain
MPEKRPTKFLLFLQKKPDSDAICEYIVDENLIQLIRFNGINDLKIFLKGESFPLTFPSQEVVAVYNKLKTMISPEKIN